MHHILLPCFAALVACTSSPQEAAMRNPDLVPANAPGDLAGRADSPAEAEGRRTLSTAFVRVGPGGHLTVALRDGSEVVLRDVVMRARDYCGVQVSGDAAGSRFCGGYGEVAAARPRAGGAVESAQ